MRSTQSFDPASLLVGRRRALVTGGATGIGRAIAEALAACGADVAVTYRSHAPDEVLEGLRATGRAAAAVPCDFAGLDRAGAQRLIDEAEEAVGPIDILVNNAGVIHREPASDYAEEAWRRVLSVNLDAAFYVSQAAGKGMLARRFGRIVNVASVLSFEGGILVPAYAASKHALAGLTKALCNEWAGQGVTVNAVAPGYTATDNTAALRADTERASAILARIPAGRWAEPNDIAGAAVFLASGAAGYVNGEILAVDGGWLAR